MTAPFPTRKLEAWRYADLAALKPIWDALPQPKRIEVPAGEKHWHVLLPGGEDVEVRRAEILLGEAAAFDLYALNASSDYSRIELDVTLREGADFSLHAAQIAGGDANVEIVTTVRHVAPAARSRQTVRSVLGGKATGSFLGKVAVARPAQKTDAEQSVKAMLLERGATANCKPELEIFADDVKCAHGASVGELDPAQMFYAMSRGLDQASARALLLEGFIADLWEGIPEQAQRAQIADRARAALRVVA